MVLDGAAAQAATTKLRLKAKTLPPNCPKKESTFVRLRPDGSS